MFPMFSNRLTFIGENEQTNVDGFVFLPFHIYRRHLSPRVRKMCPIPKLVRIGENISFHTKRLNRSYKKKYKFLVDIWNHGKRVCVVKTTEKMLNWFEM